jgi:proteasome assembly chaperone 4
MGLYVAKRFPGNQVHLTLSLSSKLMNPNSQGSGSSHDPFASKVLLVMEKKMSAWLQDILDGEGKA